MADTSDLEEQRLKRALSLIGAEVNRPEPDPEPATGPAPGARRLVRWLAGWRRRVAVAAVAVAVVGVIVAGFLVGGSDPEPTEAAGSGAGGAAQGESSRGLNWRETIACARKILVGEVQEVREADEEGRIVVTVDVEEWYKPEEGPRRIELDLIDPETIQEKRWENGQRELFIIHHPDRYVNNHYMGRVSNLIERLEREIPKATDTTCPEEWRRTYLDG